MVAHVALAMASPDIVSNNANGEHNLLPLVRTSFPRFHPYSSYKPRTIAHEENVRIKLDDLCGHAVAIGAGVGGCARNEVFL